MTHVLDIAPHTYCKNSCKRSWQSNTTIANALVYTKPFNRTNPYHFDDRCNKACFLFSIQIYFTHWSDTQGLPASPHGSGASELCQLNQAVLSIIGRDCRGISVTVGRLNEGSPEECFTDLLQTWFGLGLPEKTLELLQYCTLGLPAIPKWPQHRREIAGEEVSFEIGPTIPFWGLPGEDAFWVYRIVIDRLGLPENISSGVAEQRCRVIGLPESFLGSLKSSSFRTADNSRLRSLKHQNRLGADFRGTQRNRHFLQYVRYHASNNMVEPSDWITRHVVETTNSGI